MTNQKPKSYRVRLSKWKLEFTADNATYVWVFNDEADFSARVPQVLESLKEKFGREIVEGK